MSRRQTIQLLVILVLLVVVYLDGRGGDDDGRHASHDVMRQAAPDGVSGEAKGSASGVTRPGPQARYQGSVRRDGGGSGASDSMIDVTPKAFVRGVGVPKGDFWPIASESRTMPALASRHLVKYTWEGREHGEDGDVAEYLNRIDMPADYPCKTLLTCVHEIALLFGSLEYAHGILVVGTGTGRSAIIRYETVVPHRGGWIPYYHQQQHSNSSPGVIFSAARKLVKPAVFHLGVHDIDLYGYRMRMPRLWAGRLEPLWKYPLLFITHCNPSVDNNGHVGKQVIPIPHHVHLMHALEYPQDGRFDPRLLPQNNYSIPYKARQRKVYWRGSTTGLKYADDAHYSTLPYMEHTDRGRTVAYFRKHEDINDVWFSGIAQAHPGGEWIRSTVSGVREWLLAGRVWIDVDGNSNSWEGLRWKLLHGGPVLKIRSTGGHVQWYYHLLQDRVHLRHVDLDRDDIAATARELLDNEEYANRMIENAMRLSIESANSYAAVDYMRNAIENCWENVDEFAQRDWRIRPAPRGGA